MANEAVMKFEEHVTEERSAYLSRIFPASSVAVIFLFAFLSAPEGIHLPLDLSKFTA